MSIVDKPKNAPSNNPEGTPKKPSENVGPPGPQLGPLGSYGIYPMYPGLQPYGYPPDHPAAPKGMPPNAIVPGAIGPGGPPQSGPPPRSSNNPQDIKEPPLDLISKPPQVVDTIGGGPPTGPNKEPSQPSIPPANQNKGLPHYFPYK